MVFVEPLGEGEGGLPRLLYLGSRLYIFEAAHVLLVGQDLGGQMITFIFCETTLFDSAFFHITADVLNRRCKYYNQQMSQTKSTILNSYIIPRHTQGYK